MIFYDFPITLLFTPDNCNFFCFLKSIRKSPSTAVYTVILFSYRRYIIGLYSIGHNKTNKSFNTAVFFCISNTVLYLLLAEETAVSGHLSPTPLVAAYENHSRKRPAPVTDTFFAFRGCPLTRASTVLIVDKKYLP